VPKVLPAISIVIVASCLAAGDAAACRGLDSMQTVLFDRIPDNVDAPLIVQVKVIKLKTPAGTWTRRTDKQQSAHTALVRIIRVVKGSTPARRVALISPASDCDVPLTIGDAGIVIGDTRRAPRGPIEFVPVSLLITMFRPL
jgi:hypothetical protein